MSAQPEPALVAGVGSQAYTAEAWLCMSTPVTSSGACALTRRAPVRAQQRPDVGRARVRAAADRHAAGHPGRRRAGGRHRGQHAAAGGQEPGARRARRAPLVLLLCAAWQLWIPTGPLLWLSHMTCTHQVMCITLLVSWTPGSSVRTCWPLRSGYPNAMRTRAGALEATLQERAALKHAAPTFVQVAASARKVAQHARALLATAGLATRARRGLQVLRQAQALRRARVGPWTAAQVGPGNADGG